MSIGWYTKLLIASIWFVRSVVSIRGSLVEEDNRRVRQPIIERIVTKIMRKMAAGQA